jgi:arabinan endo-1,5-alpha-L-arabinosidase
MKMRAAVSENLGNRKPGSWKLGLRAAVAVCAIAALAGCNSKISPSLATPQLTLTASTSSINLNGSVTLTAAISGGSSPIGVVTFYTGTTALQAIDVTGKTSVSTTVTTLSPGANTLTAVYGGDQANNPVISAPATVTVSVPTTTTVTASPTLPAVGDPVTLTATVAAGAYTPTGSVTFTSGGATLGTASLASVNGNQVASVVTTALPLGTDAITATYTPSSYFLGSTSNPASVQVHAALIKTGTALVTTPTGTIASGTATTLSATITPASAGSAVPSGTVTFYDGTLALGTVAIANNAATFTTKQFTVGANSLTAVYSGDAIYATSSSTATSVTMNAYTGATYTNPLNVTATSGKVYSCPDPAILKSQTAGSDTWYAYCGGDVLNSVDGKNHLISIYSSTDLINWTYVRDALTALPAWVQSGQELQQPAIKLINGVYTLYFSATSSASPNGPGIGYATAATPAGPFVSPATPLIAQSLLFTGGPSVTKYSPEIIADQSNNLWLTYGGVYGGIVINQLNATGTALVGTSTSIGVDNYYQYPFIWSHNGYFYEFLSAGATYLSNADTNGPGLASLNVHVGRSTSILGPYLDAEGNDLNAYSNVASRYAPGGDPVLMPNGNDLQGIGSNVLFTDEAGQDYILYSGISKKQPYLPNYGGYQARQLCMDAIDWTNGWPRARNGFGPSDFSSPQPVPAAQPLATNGYVTPTYVQDSPGTLIAASSDEFNSTTLSSQWTFLHATPSYTLTGTAYAVQSVSQESVVGSSMPNLPILAEPAPTGNYLMEVKLSTTASPTAFYTTNQQAGVFIYSSDTNYLRLDEFTDFDTRQIEYLNQYGPGILAANSPYDYQFAPVGTPNFYASTYLRIAHRVGTNGAPDTYTSYSSTDGITYLTGPTWTATYASPKIGLFAGNTAGYTVSFDYIHVSTLKP